MSLVVSSGLTRPGVCTTHHHVCFGPFFQGISSASLQAGKQVSMLRWEGLIIISGLVQDLSRGCHQAVDQVCGHMTSPLELEHPLPRSHTHLAASS